MEHFFSVQLGKNKGLKEFSLPFTRSFPASLKGKPLDAGQWTKSTSSRNDGQLERTAEHDSQDTPLRRKRLTRGRGFAKTYEDSRNQHGVVLSEKLPYPFDLIQR